MNRLVWEALAMGVALLSLVTSYRLCITRQALYGAIFSGVGLAALGGLCMEISKTTAPNGVTPGLIGCVIVASFQLRILLRSIETCYRGVDCERGELD